LYWFSEEEDDNIFDDSSNNFIPGIFNREMQNDNMENYMHITYVNVELLLLYFHCLYYKSFFLLYWFSAQGNMFGQSNNYFIPNFNYGQEHNVVNMRMVL